MNVKTPKPSDAPLKLFISYSHKDEADREKFVSYLGQLVRFGKYTIWEDRRLIAGDEWKKTIPDQISQTDVYVALLSPNALASEHVTKTEFKMAKARADAGKTRIVPVILKPCLWEDAVSPFAPYQGLPPKIDQVESIKTHPKGEDAAFQEVVKGLSDLNDEIRNARRWRIGLRRGSVLLAGLALLGLPFIHTQLQREAETGWRLLRVGGHAGAAAHFARAAWWPGLDAHGREAAELGGMLAELGDTAQRRRFVPALDALERDAPAGSPAQAYAHFLRAVETFERGLHQQDPAIWLVETNQWLQAAAEADPQLADALALQANLLAINCQLNDALATNAAAQKAAGTLSAPHYLIEQAQILQSRNGPGDAAKALGLYESQSNEAEAQFALALAQLDAARWPEARAALARAAPLLAQQRQRPAWLLDLPDGPWLLGAPDAKACALAYTRAVADALADGKPGVASAWRAVPGCAAVEPDARALLCAHLPDSANAARAALACASPRPLPRCATPTHPPAA